MTITTSVPMGLKTWFARIIRSRITIAFFLFVLANYAAQTTLHVMVLLGFSRGDDLVASVIDAVGVQRGFTVATQGALEICSGIPTVQGTTCYTVYNDSAISTLTDTDLVVQCAEGLTWLENYLRNSKSEELVFLVWGSWLLAISLIALIDESIPHLIVVLFAQVVNTGWISYRITVELSTNRIYDEIIVNGTCGGFDLLGGSWNPVMFYVTLGFSVTALLCMLLFVFMLVKLYSKETLSSVGSSPIINRMLKWRLWMRVSLLFTSFFVLASAVIWYDKRKTDMIAPYSTDILYDAGFYAVAIMIVPWLTLGTYSISKENRVLFFIYAQLSTGLLVIFGLWFGSALFRYEYGVWSFFRCVSTMAGVLLVITFVLSFICRVHFGRGLAQFLIVEGVLLASGFTRDIFQRGPSNSRKPGAEQVFTSDRPEPLSHPVVNPSDSSFETSKRPPSASSLESVVFAAWLSSKANGDEEKCQLQAVTQGELANPIIIPKEHMRSWSIRSTSDDDSNTGDEVDERQKILS